MTRSDTEQTIEALHKQLMQGVAAVEAIQKLWDETNYDDLRVSAIRDGAERYEVNQFVSRAREVGTGDVSTSCGKLVTNLHALDYRLGLIAGTAELARNGSPVPPTMR